jgi:hypothetical protein
MVMRGSSCCIGHSSSKTSTYTYRYENIIPYRPGSTCTFVKRSSKWHLLRLVSRLANPSGCTC